VNTLFSPLAPLQKRGFSLRIPAKSSEKAAVATPASTECTRNIHFFGPMLVDAGDIWADDYLLGYDSAGWGCAIRVFT
jgi:hypothetical protein